ncbi:sensor histidine kinase [Aeromicrobium sp.]|uniref:sensor histidine kinase n=1 Tax=Aeromicrobium sp. TaxID=1871063 RepID=UPI002FCA0A61
MVDGTLVTQVVRYAFVIRLTSLLFVLLDPDAVATSLVGYLAVLFITATSALGLYATDRLTASVAAHPFLIVVDVLVAGLIGASIGTQSPIVLYSMSTAVLIGILLRRRYIVLILTILVGLYVLTTVAQVDAPSLMTITLAPVSYITICALASLTRTIHDAAMIDQAHARRSSEDAARERERSRLAREMHDSVAKSLHGIGLAAASLPMWAANKPEELGERARELQHAAESASRDARAILVDLRADPSATSVSEQVRVMAEDLSMGGVRTTLSLTDPATLGAEAKRELVEIIAESLENVRRHSRATQVEVTVAETDGSLQVSVNDNGVGFDPSQTPRDHFGLVGIRERAEAVGATCEIVSSPGSGTQITVELPLTPSEQP